MSINSIDNIYIYNKDSCKKQNVENNPINGVDNFSSIIFSLQPTTLNSKSSNLNFNNDNEIKDVEVLKQDLENTKSKQGIIGNLWDGFKNLTGIGASSFNAQKAIENYENGEITEQEMQKAVDGYINGQKMVVDVTADIASSVLAIGAFALAVPSGGASLAVGLGLAAAVGAGAKVGVKAGDALISGKEYTTKDLAYDSVTGGVNGLLAPVTNGVGNTVTKTIASKIIKEGAEEAMEQTAKQGLKQVAKNIILNQSDEIIGGTLKQRAIALGAGMAVDGALGGASDNMVRAGLNGENVLEAGFQGAVGGLILSPIIGGGFKIAGKAGKALNVGKNVELTNNNSFVKELFPDGVSNLKFKQGDGGADLNNCYFLSSLKALSLNQAMSEEYLAKNISIGDDGLYRVNFYKNGNLFEVSLSPEELSNGVGGCNVGTNSKGIKILETAYAKFKNPDQYSASTLAISGSKARIQSRNTLYDFTGIEAFEIASNQSTSMKIKNDAFNEVAVDFLDEYSKRPSDFSVVLGTKKGLTEANLGEYRFISSHAYALTGVDATARTVTVVDPYDSSVSHTISYDEFVKWFNSITGIDSSGEYNKIAVDIYEKNKVEKQINGKINLAK